jgi:hypothetical protein
MLADSRNRSTIKRLSTAISKSAGLADKKGNSTFIPEPIARWTKRKTTVMGKLKAAKSKKK